MLTEKKKGTREKRPPEESGSLPQGHGPFPDRLGPHCIAWRRRWELERRCTPQGCSHHHLQNRRGTLLPRGWKWCICTEGTDLPHQKRPRQLHVVTFPGQPAPSSCPKAFYLQVNLESRKSKTGRTPKYSNLMVLNFLSFELVMKAKSIAKS